MDCTQCQGTGQEPTFGFVHSCLLCGGHGDERGESIEELYRELGGEG